MINKWKERKITPTQTRRKVKERKQNVKCGKQTSKEERERDKKKREKRGKKEYIFPKNWRSRAYVLPIVNPQTYIYQLKCYLKWNSTLSMRSPRALQRLRQVSGGDSLARTGCLRSRESVTTRWRFQLLWPSC